MFKKILIVGCGLIGSSILRAAIKKKISKKIFILEKSKKHINQIKKLRFNCEFLKGSQKQIPKMDMINIFTVFILAIFVGNEIINKVPPTLHTPLMSGSNAISGIAIVGAIIASKLGGGLGTILGTIAVVFATINVVGGFMVTDRMLKMFKKKK